MWVYDNDYSKWMSNDDYLSKDNFDFYKQELSAVRFYSKCLSGATFLPINNFENIYDILGNYKARNWYIGINGSEYTNTLIPSPSAVEINGTSSYEFYDKYLTEEGLSLKTLFTPKRLIKDSLDNIIYVDVATTEQLTAIGPLDANFSIDGVRLVEGHKVLVKDQYTRIVLPNTTDPDTYFVGNYTVVENLGATIEYQYYNNQNGIYEVLRGALVRTTDLQEYKDAKRFSVFVKMGIVNKEKQFHLSRLLNNYYPTTRAQEPIEFTEKKNWMLRNRVDYNNLFEINYYDVIKHNDQQYFYNGVTYSIPERTLSVGEFGIILNTQKGVSNIIRNKYKVNLRSITETTTHYWISGDSGILLKVRKHDFDVEKIDLVLDNKFSISLKSVSFYNDLRGVVVGDLNTICVTVDGGKNWERLRVPDFDSFYYNKVVFKQANSFFVAGNVGIFIEMVEDVYGWSAVRRRISKFIDDDDEYLLVDNINDMYYTTLSTWGLSFSYSTQSVVSSKELLFLVTDDSKIIVHDIEDANGQFDFLYLEFGRDYDDILNISHRLNTNTFYFTGTDILSGQSGIFSFSLDDFQYIGIGNSYSNAVLSQNLANFESSYFPNEIFDFTGQEMLIAGNESLLLSSSYDQGSVIGSQSVLVTYGSLYNWYSIADGLLGPVDGRELYGIVNLSQPDWIVPSDTEWQNLVGYLSTNVGGKLKETSAWTAPNTGATNESGFSALPGALISYAGTTASTGLASFGEGGYFHSSSNSSGSTSSYWYVTYTHSTIFYSSGSQSQGLSIRLVRPTTSFEDTLPDGTWIPDAYQGNDGKNYYGVKIGTQLWMAENLRETLNNQGYSITQVYSGTSAANWINYGNLNQPAYNNFNNTANSTTYSISSLSVYTPLYTEFDFDVLDENFESRLKSKLLFLDYDAGSKMNFFNDFGEYRLPASVTFSISDFTASNSSMGLQPIVYGATFPSFATQSETNWWTYWTDREMTFEYYANSNLFTESTKVLMSSTFSYSPTQSTLSINYITSTSSVQLDLAPSTLIPNGSRFNGLASATNSVFVTGLNPTGLQPAISDPGISAADGIYLYEYLMVIKTFDTYPVNVGDVLRFDSTYVAGNFVVNKIVGGVTGKKLIYLFTDFNGNIINQLTGHGTNPIQSMTSSVTNLNSYSTVQQLEERFNLHPISNGYELDYDPVNNYVHILPKFNYFSAYYNLASSVSTTVETKTMSYTGGFLNFGYTPTYNILQYLEGLNDANNPDPIFFGDKEYYAMPEYRGIPMPGGGSFTSSECYIDYNGITYSSVEPTIPFITTNKLYFGRDLEFEWQSIFLNTYVDIHLYGGSSDPGRWPFVSPTSVSEKMLVMKKYFDEETNAFVIEFNKRIKHVLGQPQWWIDIISRRKLSQISEDLQELNNIHRPKRKKQELVASGLNVIGNGHDYWIYEREMNQKISTDSYLRILLSDVDTFENLTGVIYTDFKNELALNITKLEQKFEIPIKSTGNYLGNLFIFCSEKHGLKEDDGVVLEFNGGTFSSQFLNQDYFGYHTVKVVNEYNFYVEHPYGNIPLTGQDTGFVKYTKIDPFLNFSPVDLIDVGADKRGKISIELSPDNLFLEGSIYSLKNIDFNKYRFRLIDGLNVELLSQNFPWILEAEISGATIGVNITSQLIWYKGVWECGRWFGGRWVSGVWVSGDWYGGTWDSKDIKDNILNVEIYEKSNNTTSSKWFGGRWFDGTWNNGTWHDGRWYGGTWNQGRWFKGLWNDGIWNDGEFSGGIWILGTWNGGFFNTNSEPAYWLDGDWNAGDFENGMWYNGYFTEKVGRSRFGVNSYNSRTSTWHGGNWLSGEFHSRLNLDDEGLPDVSDVHKYSIWYTGNWYDGEFYGGVVYNIDWKSGTWYGGILEDIEVIGFGSDGVGKNYFTLNGIFKFNTKDEFTIINNQFETQYSVYGSNKSPKSYIVLDIEEFSQTFTNNYRYTKVYVASNITSDVGAPLLPGFDTTLKVVSKFRNCNWKSGIWTNGIFENGLWEGGIWYNGVFEATWM